MSESIDATAGLPGHSIRVFAGECTTIYDADRREEHRGHVTVVVKPDKTEPIRVTSKLRFIQ